MALARPTSICHMSLAEAFLTRITQDVQTSMRNNKKLGDGLGFDVVLVNMDKQAFIDSYLHHLSITKQGNFTKQRSFGTKRPNLMVYDCERSCLSKGTSTGDPTKTRANGCRAYICFGFEEGATATVCVLRYRLNHIGHNPSNREEFRVNRIDLALKTCIQEWVQECSQMSDILPKIAQWNKLKGHFDYKDRRFFPFQQDIQHLIWVAHKSRFSSEEEARQIKKHEIGLPAVDNLATQLKNKYREICTFYQPSNITLNNSKPMILVLQTQHQRDVFAIHGDKIVFITKNFEGLRMYGSAIYALVVKNERDVAYPVGFIISNSDDPVVLIQGLHKFQQTNVKTHPAAIFIDKELVSCVEGITALYPKVKIFIPRYQILKAIHDWLATSTPIADKSQREVRDVLLKYILDLSKCDTIRSFIEGLHELREKIEFPAFMQMLTSEWFPLGHMWALYGRAEIFPTDSTATMAERLYLNLEHQLLKGLQSLTRPEELVEHIAKDLSKNDPDVLIDMDDFLEGTPEEQAENLLQDGWGSLVTWTSPMEALVPSQNNLQNFFHVRLIPMECDCPCPPYRGVCVHLHLALVLVQGKADPEEERRAAADDAWTEKQYLVDDHSCAIFHSGTMCLTSTADGTCTCKASFFGCDCVGILLVKKIEANMLKEVCDPPSNIVQEQLQVCPEAPSEVVEYTVTSSLDNQHCSVDESGVLTSSLEDNSSKTLIKKMHDWSESINFKDSTSIRSQLHQIWSEIVRDETGVGSFLCSDGEESQPDQTKDADKGGKSKYVLYKNRQKVSSPRSSSESKDLRKSPYRKDSPRKSPRHRSNRFIIGPKD